jgi:hypothetical protein
MMSSSRIDLDLFSDEVGEGVKQRGFMDFEKGMDRIGGMGTCGTRSGTECLVV